MPSRFGANAGGRWFAAALALALTAIAVPGSAAAQDTLTPPTAELSLDINLPAFRLDVWDRDSLTRRFTVAIGTPAYPTPTGTFSITKLVWNPVWIPPASPWADRDTVTPPGPSNPMRKVKIHVYEDYYIHGTPLESSLGRAESHGCIRLSADDAITLARLLQTRTGAPISDGSTDSLVRYSQPTRTVALPAAVIVRLRYDIAEIRGDTATLYPDVYERYGAHKVEGTLQALATAGVDTATVRRDVLASLVGRSARSAIRVPLSQLLAVPRGDSTHRRDYGRR